MSNHPRSHAQLPSADSSKLFDQSYERAEGLGVPQGVLDGITDRLASGELTVEGAVDELEAKVRMPEPC